jgi:dephospho-CoA kinase
MQPGEADRLLATQLPSDLKRRAADFVIDNDDDLATLETRARATWQALQES